MLLLLSTLALGGPGNAALACVDGESDAPARSPRYLVPLKFEDRGVERYTRAWRDEAGNRWAWSEVRAAWAAEPYSRMHLEALDSERTVAKDGATSATAQWLSVNAKVIDQMAGNIPLDGSWVTPGEYRAERELFQGRMAAADALGSGELRHVARAMCAYNMAPRLHAEEAAERAAQEMMIAEAAAAGGPDAATWNLARMLQESRGAGTPSLADADAVQRCVQAGKGAGELMAAVEGAPAEGALSDALGAAGLSCASPGLPEPDATP